MPSIETLPVEIFHRIFDNLDGETILLSIRLVSRLFRSVVDTYNRYTLDMKLISKSNFHLLCRLVHPQNIISITLSNDEPTSDQISLFVSSVHLQGLTRLHSLTLLEIDECQLEIILKHIELSYLTSFSFSVREVDDSPMKTTTNLLSSIIEKSNLRKLEYGRNNILWSEISWPINCTIEYLTINNNIHIGNLCIILQHCLHLHTLVVRKTYHRKFNNIISKSFQQLTSLTIERFHGTIDELESFLSLTPSLVYLKLISGEEMIDGNRWQEFIRIHLSHLNKFEFFFQKLDGIERTLADVELIIASFRTPFWIEFKKWFVTCEYDSDEAFIYLYSIPICKSSLKYQPQYRIISLSTCPMMIQDDPAMMNNVQSITLILDESLADHIQEKKATAISPLFPKVTEIDIVIRNEWPLRSMQSLSMLIDFSKIVQFVLNANYRERLRQKPLIGINLLFEEMQNLSSLFICRFSNESSQTIGELCAIIPRCVKHLQTPVRNLEQIETIFERCEKLSTIAFDCENLEFSKVVEWLDHNTINSTCCMDYETVFVWVGKRTI